MQPINPPSDEIRILRHCVRDVVSLSALSAAWGRTEPQGIAESLADVLLNTLDVDFIYVRVKGLAEGVTHEVVHNHRGQEPASRAQEIGRALEPLLKCGGPQPPPMIDNPVGEGTVRSVGIPIGYEGDCGFLVAASPRPNFPEQTDRLLLGVGANQAAVVLQHKRAERALRQSHLRYRMVARAANDAIWDWDLITDQVTWNEGLQTLCGYTADQVGPDSAWWHGLIHPDDRERVVLGIDAMIGEGKELWVDEYQLLRADGTYAYVIDRGFVVYDDRSKPLRMVGSMLDLTERRRLEESLRESDRRKSEFLATLAHELRNPLAPIRNALEILRRTGGDGPVVEQARCVMERQVRQMVRLVDDLLDIARISRDKLELRRERVELAAAVQSAVETSRPLLDAGGHRLTVVLPSEPIWLDADLTRLAQVFLNLLSNAAKYTERGGEIRLTAERQGPEVVVRVRDTGIGIPAEMLPRIFEMFTQVDQSLERSQGGLGIGLTLVKRLVEMHGGSIEARSDGPGLGSEFVVRLPVVAGPPTLPEPQVRDGKPGTTAPPKRRILIVDDNEDSARSLCRLLTMTGSEARTTHDGLSALAVAAEFRPDVILLDIGLPGLNGYEVARKVRGQRGEDVVLVAVTGWGQEDDRRRSQEAGFDYHMVKPVDFNELQRLLADQKPAST